jgi:hypothetical protein
MLRCESFDADVMESLLRLPKGIIPQDTTKMLQRYKKKKENGNTVLVRYDFATGCRILRKGRVYPTPWCGLTVFPREIRAALAKSIYQEIDFENSQPRLFTQVAPKFNVSCEALKEYVENRTEILKEIQETHTMSRDEAKTILLAVLFGGVRSQHPILPRMAAELNALALALAAVHPEYQEAAKKDKSSDAEKWGYKKNPVFGGLAIYIQNEERLCLEALANHLEKTDRKMDVLIYDGGLVRRMDESPIPTTLLIEWEEEVLAKTGYTVIITEKELKHSFDFTRKDRVVPSDVRIDDAYAAERFVKMCGENMRMVGCDFYCCLDGVWTPGPSALRSLVKAHKEELVFKQYVDAKIRIHNYGGDLVHIEKMLKLLPVYAIKSEMPIQFAYTLVEEEEDQVAVERFLYLCDLVCGKKPLITNYFIKWMAHLIQKPNEKCGVMMVFIGDKGVGKDTTPGVLMKTVVGDIYSHNYTKTAMMFEKHNIDMMGKLIVKLEELSKKECTENQEAIRGMITGDKISFNPKNIKDTIQQKNCIRFIGTTNTASPFKLDKERRFCYANSSSEKKGDHAFWKETYEMLETPAAGRAIGLFLEKVDLSNFNIRDAPVSEYQDAVEAVERSTEDLFLEAWDGERCSATELFSKYGDYCRDNELQQTADHSNTFGKRILLLLGRHKIEHERKSGGSFYWK